MPDKVNNIVKLFILIGRAGLIIIYGYALFMAWGFGVCTTNFWARLGFVVVGILLFAPEIKKVFRLKDIRSTVGFLLIVCGITFLIHHYIAGKYYKRMFENFVYKPIPKTVKLLKADSGRWLGPVTYVVFKTDRDTFDQLAVSFEKIDADLMRLEIEQFSQYSGIPITPYKGLICYRKITEKEEWTEREFLLWDFNNQRGIYYRPYVLYKSEKMVKI